MEIYQKYATYPQNIMAWKEKFDPDTSQMADINRYQTLRVKSYLTPEEQVEFNALATKLADYIFTSNDLNTIGSNMVAMQVHYRDNTSSELERYKQELKDFSNEYQSLTRIMYQSWTTTSSKDYNIRSGNESLDANAELMSDSPACIEVTIDGKQIGYNNYNIVADTDGKKTIIRFNSGFTVTSGVRMECRWQDTSGRVFSVSSHQHAKSDITDLPNVAKTGSYLDLLNIPSTFPPVAHNHVWSQITEIPSTFPPAAHTHDDRYYTESEMDSKLTGKANTSHTHDDRYYTESEMDTKLNGKANSSHTHTIANITGLQGEINNLKSSVSNGKIQVANAITAKGVYTSTTAEFATMASNIAEIPSISLSNVPTSRMDQTGYLPEERTSPYASGTHTTNATLFTFVPTVLGTNIAIKGSSSIKLYGLRTDKTWQESGANLTTTLYMSSSSTERIWVYNPNKATVTFTLTTDVSVGVVLK